MGRRIALLIAAIVVAALGTGLIYLYVKGANDRALAGQQPVSVLVAKNEIPAGTSVQQAISQGDVVEMTVARTSAISGAMTTLDPVKSFYALTTIFPRQQLSAQMFGQVVAGGSALPIPSGSMAVSFQFSDPQRVAGFVEPGSNVVVFLTIQGKNGKDVTQVLLPKAQVIGVGPTTLALDDSEAVKLVYGSQHGTLYLGLLNDKSKVSSNTNATASNLFG